MPEQRWAALVAGAATAILDIVVLPAGVSRAIARRLESMLLHEALTHIGRADSSPSASNPVPLGPNSVHFNPLTDHQCREPRDGSVPELHPSLFLTGTVG